MVFLKGIPIKSGYRVSVKIRGDLIIDAKINIGELDERRGSDHQQAWICHNNPKHNGSESPDMLGYKYSWQFCINKVTGHFTDNITELNLILPNVESKNDVVIDININRFLTSNSLEKLTSLFQFKLGIFDEFQEYISSKDGFIILKNEKKSVEIKLSRFIRQMSFKYDKLVEGSDISKLEISDSDIESINNKWISYQKSGGIEISFLAGKEILEGYTKSNYHSDGIGTLHKSCMVDKFDFLKIYTENPNQVRLAVVKFDDKIVARGLVWNATDGKMYSDRIYYTIDWLEEYVRETLRKQGILPLSEHNFRTVQLEKWEFKYYPYMDNMFTFDVDSGILLSQLNNRIRTLRSTNG